MENCGSAVVVVIGFFGPSLLPLEITDGGLQEDHGILETSQAPVTVVAQETSDRPVFVVVVHGELAAPAIATTDHRGGHKWHICRPALQKVFRTRGGYRPAS